MDGEQYRDKGVSVEEEGEIASRGGWQNSKSRAQIKNKEFFYMLKSDSSGGWEIPITMGVDGGKHMKKFEEKSFNLLRAKAENKDQSYFLYRLNQNDLSHTIFPIGDFNKEEVREIAKKNNFPNADKKGTSGICIVGKINVKEYLKHKIKPKKGNILDPHGKKVGEHDGIYYYTIGERIGPRHGITFEKTNQNPQNIKRWYVAKKDPKKNILIVAPQDHPLLYRKEIFVSDLHFINPKEKIPRNIDVRIRHVGELLDANLSKLDKREFVDSIALSGVRGRGGGGHNKVAKNINIKITLKTPITGISEGQAIVFYKKNSSLVLGGGVISF